MRTDGGQRQESHERRMIARPEYIFLVANGPRFRGAIWDAIVSDPEFKLPVVRAAGEALCAIQITPPEVSCWPASSSRRVRDSVERGR